MLKIPTSSIGPSLIRRPPFPATVYTEGQPAQEVREGPKASLLQSIDGTLRRWLMPCRPICYLDRLGQLKYLVDYVR